MRKSADSHLLFGALKSGVCGLLVTEFCETSVHDSYSYLIFQKQMFSIIIFILISSQWDLVCSIWFSGLTEGISNPAQQSPASFHTDRGHVNGMTSESLMCVGVQPPYCPHVCVRPALTLMFLRALTVLSGWQTHVLWDSPGHGGSPPCFVQKVKSLLPCDFQKIEQLLRS